jgi:tetratricopeptide (TPR) repeat protein
MNKNQLIELIKSMSVMFDQKHKESILEKMETLIKQYLEKHQHDTDIWIRLIMLEFTPPWEDPDRITSYVQKIYEYEPSNIPATLILAYIQELTRGGVFEDTFQRLLNLETSNIYYNSMIELAKSWYYEKNKNIIEQEECLLKSINYCNTWTENYKSLGMLYMQNGQIIKGKKLIKIALKNITHIYGENYHSTDITSVEEFFNEFYKGTYITRPNLERIEKYLKV